MVRLFALSDIHVDFEENWVWLKKLSEHDYKGDVLILAGDVAYSTALIQKTFKALKKLFSEVLYVPGNHDLWVKRPESKTSLDKFQTVREIALDSGLRLDPVRFGNVTVVPLLGWYDYSFGRPSEELKKSWVDYVACKWPEGWDDAKITKHFTSMNEKHLDLNNQIVVSFSHFLPRADLLPSKIPSVHRKLYPVFGTSLLERQVRTLGSKIHIYGHHHLNLRVSEGNTAYINNALGYPYETNISSRKLLCVLDV